MASGLHVRVEGLKPFRAALKRGEMTTPKVLSVALKAAAQPVIERAGELAPKRSGKLSGSYRPQLRATEVYIRSTVPYGPGAEWGQRGKWTGFAKYGARGNRFAGRAVEEKANEAAERFFEALEEPLSAYGWLR